MITRKSLADEIDLLDADIKVLNDSKTAAFKAYREQLAAAGVAKENIAKEIEASKAAIKRRRATTKDEDAVLETEALVDEIYHEITTKARAPRTRVEIIEEFDPITGEFLEDGTADDNRSDAGLSIVSKHTEITSSETTDELCRPALSAVSGGEPSEPSPDAGGVKMDDGCTSPGRSDEQSAYSSAKSGQATDTISISDQPLKGGDEGHSVAGIPTSNTGEGAASALPANSGVVMEDVPEMPMKRPAFISCFPELQNAEYAHLREEIRDHGICKPIIRQGDVIVDGWERFLISRELGFDYPIIAYTGTDVLLDVIELQRVSRNFTPAQSAKIAADLAKEFPRRADEIMTAFGLVEALEAAE